MIEYKQTAETKDKETTLKAEKNSVITYAKNTWNYQRILMAARSKCSIFKLLKDPSNQNFISSKIFLKR